MPDNQSLSVYTVNAFTDKPFGGNPAAVVPLEVPLSDQLMQAIAAQHNLS
ncbi:MAG: PhzF family phenazine biosynthesis protein, partial [Halieaceae bacterium]|nr:PhzF family phenazine biosynthesis protein [Halieaceae bacterium]